MTNDEFTGTDTGDREFLARLTAADPIDPTNLPAAEDPKAAELLTGILAADVTGPTSLTAGAAPGPRPVGVPAPSPPVRRSFLTRGRGALVAVAAAVLLLVGAVAVLAPDSTPAAVAQVRAAAATAADADSGRIVSSFALDYADAETADAAGGTIEVIYDDGDLGISVDVDQIPAEIGDDADEILPSLDDIRLVDDVAYVQDGEQWYAVETGGLLGDLVVRYIDPRTVLDTVQTLTEVTEVGPAEVDGVAVTQFRSVIDLGDDTLAQSGWLAFDGMNVEVDGEVTVDLYVFDGGDDDGVLRRFDLSGDLQAPDGEDGSATFQVATTFSGLGDDISLEAPEGAELIDPLNGGFGFDDDTADEGE